jgi:hypothetical protein
MAVNALVNTEKPIIMIYDPDQGHPEEYAEIEFMTRDDANAAVTKLNTIFKNGDPDHLHAATVEPRCVISGPPGTGGAEDARCTACC